MVAAADDTRIRAAGMNRGLGDQVTRWVETRWRNPGGLRFSAADRAGVGRERVWWRSSRGVTTELSAGAGAAALRRTAKLARLEAALLVSDAALSPRRIAQVAAR